MIWLQRWWTEKEKRKKKRKGEREKEDNDGKRDEERKEGRGWKISSRLERLLTAFAADVINPVFLSLFFSSF